MAKQKSTERIERCVCKEEAEASVLAKGLVLKPPPHQNNPKWVAIEGTRPICKVLGRPKNYTHKLIFEVETGTIEWLKQFETKENEPDSFEIPVERIIAFNARVIEIHVQKSKDIVPNSKK